MYAIQSAIYTYYKLCPKHNTLFHFTKLISYLLCWTISYTGSFEREVLKHFDSIVERSLPLEKVTSYYKQCPGTAKQVILDYVTFFEERKTVSQLRVILYVLVYLCTNSTALNICSLFFCFLFQFPRDHFLLSTQCVIKLY